ncbi:DUF899 domain-containing protein [bacterium]|nr:DUF899 domain-containing protein [bacterium]
MSTANHPVVSREVWLEARRSFLAKEKDFTRQRDELSRERQTLPWVRLDQDYVFESADGPVNLDALFGKQSQLLVYHFMFAPEWSQGCQGCSFLADHFNPLTAHLPHRDVSLVMVSQAPIEKISAFRERMGWTLPWVSAAGNDFSRDFQVSFTQEEQQSGLAIYNYEAHPKPLPELPGLSAFYRDGAGNIYHTYSTYARGLDIFLGMYHLLDVAPKGRNENPGEGMSWLRHHDRYDDANFVVPWMEHAQTAGAQAS